MLLIKSYAIIMPPKDPDMLILFYKNTSFFKCLQKQTNYKIRKLYHSLDWAANFYSIV